MGLLHLTARLAQSFFFEARGSECATAAQTSCFAKREVCVYLRCLCVCPFRDLNFSIDACFEKADFRNVKSACGRRAEFGLVLSGMQSPAFK